MSRSGRTWATTMAVVALSSWSCGSTAPDATPLVDAIVVSPASSTIAPNARLPMQAEVRDGSGAIVPDAAITWTVQDPKVVSVSAEGIVTALAVGTSKVAANALGKSGLATITVARRSVADVAVAPGRVDILVGASSQLSASALDVGGAALADRAIAWTTSDHGVATVNGSGLVTGVGAGTATITASSEGRSGTSVVNVTLPAVVRVDLEPASTTLQAGRTQTLVATPRDAKGNGVGGRTVTWSSDDAAVARVSAGLVTTSRAGVATITASVGTVKGAATITVIPGPVATVAVAAPKNKLKAKSTMQLTATARDDQGNAVSNQSFSWSSSNTNTATVSSGGLVTGKRSGTVTITARTSDGKSGSVQIDVN